MLKSMQETLQAILPKALTWEELQKLERIIRHKIKEKEVESNIKGYQCSECDKIFLLKDFTNKYTLIEAIEKHQIQEHNFSEDMEECGYADKLYF